jgi:hypothetical protein
MMPHTCFGGDSGPLRKFWTLAPHRADRIGHLQAPTTAAK